MHNKNKMKVIGIDPGFGRVGVSIVEKTRTTKETLIFSTCIETDSKELRHKRIFDAVQEIGLYVEKYKPDALAIETLFFTNNQKTALGVAEARGAIMYEVMRKGLQIFEYTPNQVKVAVTGNGNSDKASIIKMIPLLVSMSKNMKDSLDDEYDAIAIALTCLACDFK